MKKVETRVLDTGVTDTYLVVKPFRKNITS